MSPSLRSLAGRLGRLGRLVRRPPSALIVPVPESETAVAPWRARHDPSAARGMPAHVTVLYPFLPPSSITPSVERELEALVAGFASFTFELARIGRFPGVLYLAPEPAAPFRELTAAVHERWPDHPPYGGAFETVVPHLTVVQGSEPPEVADELESAVPIDAVAAEVCLMAQAGGRWTLRRRFTLGDAGG